MPYRVLLRRFLFILVLFPMIITSCSNDYNRAIRRLQNRKIDLTFNQQLIKKDSIITDVQDFAPIKIVVYADTTLCMRCLSNFLKASDTYVKTFNKDSVAFICILEPRSISVLQEELNELNLEYVNVIVDVDNKYLINNRIEEYRDRFTSFLLDRDNKVVLVGNPLRGKDLKELYNKTIPLLINNGGKMPLRKIL